MQETAEKMKLSEIIDVFVTGDWGNESSSVESPHAVSCVRGADIVPIGNNEFGKIPLRYISDRSFQQRLLQVGDIVVEKSGGSPTQSTGRAVYISQPLLSARRNIVCSNFCVAFRVKHGWNPYFIYLYWRYLYNSGVFFNFEGKTSGIKNLQLDVALSTIEIEPYSIEEQIRIADCLFSIEKKLQLNRSINHNLEAMAKQLYDYWFVQFDFPDENGMPYKSSGGKMVWNEKLKREIPEGWHCFHLNEIEPNIVTGKTPSTTDETNFGGDIPFITIDDIRKSRFVFQTTRTLSEKGAYSQLSKYIPIGSLCCSCIGTVGILGFVGKRGQTNQQINTVVFENEHNKEYIYFSLGVYFSYANAKVGNILPNMSKEDFCQIPLLYPTKALVMEYHKKVEHLFNQIECLIANIEGHTKLRDSLLPLLMNGQVSVNYDLSND